MAVPSGRVQQWALHHVVHCMQANVAKMLQRVWDKGDIYKDRYSGTLVCYSLHSVPVYALVVVI